MASLLDKIKALDPKVHTWHPYHKIGTVLGVTGLGLAGTNFVQAQRSNQIDLERKQIEAKSLAALQRIHKALAIKPTENI
jgi:hypothetical protein